MSMDCWQFTMNIRNKTPASLPNQKGLSKLLTLSNLVRTTRDSASVDIQRRENKTLWPL